MQKPSMASQAATLDLDLQLDLVPRGTCRTSLCGLWSTKFSTQVPGIDLHARVLNLVLKYRSYS